jgi:hypothetical protein
LRCDYLKKVHTGLVLYAREKRRKKLMDYVADVCAREGDQWSDHARSKLIIILYKKKEIKHLTFVCWEASINSAS